MDALAKMRALKASARNPGINGTVEKVEEKPKDAPESIRYPWAYPQCKAKCNETETPGLNSKGNDCKICRNQNITSGFPSAQDFKFDPVDRSYVIPLEFVDVAVTRARADAPDTRMQHPNGNPADAMTVDEWEAFATSDECPRSREGVVPPSRAEIVTEVVSEESTKTPEPEPTKTSEPETQIKVVASEPEPTKTSEPEPQIEVVASEPEPAKKPATRRKKRTAKAKAASLGNDKNGHVLLTGCTAIKAVTAGWGDFYELFEECQREVLSMAEEESQDVSLFWGLNAFSRRDAMAGYITKATNDWPEHFVILAPNEPGSPDMKHFLELLKAHCGTVITS